MDTKNRICIHCGADISHRHALTTTCSGCWGKWERKSGAQAAWNAVSAAVKRGDLSPATSQVCVDCGEPATHYDHRDYNKPLDVQPVCRSCNKKRGAAIHRKEAA